VETEIVALNGASLDLGAGTLTRDGAPVPLRARWFVLLAHLARRLDRVVPKGDLMDAVWPDVTVTEDSLTQAVRDIRVALGDDAGQVLQTVRGRGYCLRARATAAAAMPARAEVPRLALVPFEDRTGLPALAPVIDILCDEVASGLSRFRSLAVLGRASVEAAQRLHPGDPVGMARALRASYVVEGVARRDGEGFLASIRLTDDTGAVVWSESFDCAGDRVLTLRDRVPQGIVRQLSTSVEVEAGARAARRPTDSLTAFEYYARAVSELRVFLDSANRAALVSLQKAIDADPNFGPAYTLKAQAELATNNFGFAPAAVHERALALARQGALLSPQDGRCQSTLGWVLLFLRQYETAERTVQLALRLNPLDPETLSDSAVVALCRGRFEEALDLADRALELNPLPPPYYETTRCEALYMLGRYEEAVASMSRLPELNGWRSLFMAVLQMKCGRLDEARRFRARALTLLPPGEDWPACFARAWHHEHAEHSARLGADLRAVLALGD
jgi:DNA-binding winged helix-turn-helix (wHTH) protein/tetratricopeptide (TPR) repeat protein